MWDNSEGQGNGAAGKGEVYWRTCPEFSHLANYHPPPLENQQQTDIPLKSKISGILALNRKDGKMSIGGEEAARKEVEAEVLNAFLAFLSRTLGFAAETFDEGQALAVYGLDSLSAVGVQYWGWRGVSRIFYPGSSLFLFIALFLFVLVFIPSFSRLALPPAPTSPSIGASPERHRVCGDPGKWLLSFFFFLMGV